MQKSDSRERRSSELPPHSSFAVLISRQKARNPFLLVIPLRCLCLRIPTEMDIPDADELEWLEANSHYQDFPEDEDFDPHPYPYPPESEPEPEPEQAPRNLQPDTSAPSSIISDVAAGKKRPPSPEEHSISSDDEPSEPKRSRSNFTLTAEVIKDEHDLLMELGFDRGDVVLESVEKEEVKYLSQFASEIDGDCVPVTGPCGERVYAKIDKDESAVGVKNFKISVQSGGLLSEPINTLLQRLEQQSLLKALQASSETQHESLLNEELVPVEQLWVDKYSPKSFTELLSDEHTNREVLLWLKQWDSAVFGADIRNTTDEVLTALRRHSSISYHPKRSDTNFARKNRDFRGRSFAGNQENIRPQGDQGSQSKKIRNGEPPDQKVLLLCGPPGLGKTTLAHVAARHCGYHVVEINASDDRSASAIETKILDAIQMNSVMADSKPKCLVIDEIDGALGDGKGAIEVILKMVAAEKNSESSKDVSPKEQQFARKSSNRGRKAVSLSRPVICICNDLYAPALRPLRQVAKVHMFTQPTLNRVVSRIKYICNKEGMKTSSIALTELARYTECDIRSCLNTLQFLNNKKTSLNAIDIGSQVIGRKDMAKSLFDIWTEIFQKRKVKGNRKFSSCWTSMLDAQDSLYSLISNRGDYEVMFDGIHENILRQQYHDPGMLKTVQCLDNLGTSDLFNQRIMSSHNMVFYIYQPPLAITIHRQVCQVGKPIFEWPRSFHRYRISLMANIETLRSWHCKIIPGVSRHMSIRTFIGDTLSLLLHILSPPTLRPVALHLLSEAERNYLFQLVCTMVTYSITYKNVKNEFLTNGLRHEGMTNVSLLSLDPPIEVLVRFKGYNPGHYELTSAVKQLLTHEVEKQKILKSSNNRNLSSDDNDALGMKRNAMSTSEPANKLCMLIKADSNVEQTRKKSQTIESESSICKVPLTGNLDTSSQAVKPESLGGSKKAATGSFNFFERFRKPGSKGSHNAETALKAATLERDRRPGFTNAVKKPVRIRELRIDLMRDSPVTTHHNNTAAGGIETND
ncbi:hypothetical protein V2J09_018001 [Rumex salicifolius]